MIKYDTWYGTFQDGEEIAAVKFDSLGERYVYKGLVRGKKYSRGIEYLVLEGHDNVLYDIALIADRISTIITGDTVKDIEERRHWWDGNKKPIIDDSGATPPPQTLPEIWEQENCLVIPEIPQPAQPQTRRSPAYNRR